MPILSKMTADQMGELHLMWTERLREGSITLSH